MRSSIFLTVFVCLASVAFVLPGCGREGCTNPFSDNFDPEATENDGSCILWRTKFLNTYRVIDRCDLTGTFTYEIDISRGERDNEIVMFNFGSFGDSLQATVEGNRFTLPRQASDDNVGNTYFLQGDGELRGDSIFFDFSSSLQNGRVDSCSSRGVRVI